MAQPSGPGPSNPTPPPGPGRTPAEFTLGAIAMAIDLGEGSGQSPEFTLGAVKRLLATHAPARRDPEQLPPEAPAVRTPGGPATSHLAVSR